MMLKPHLAKSRTSFWASLMMISMTVLSIHSACPRSRTSTFDKRSRSSGSAAAANSPSTSVISDLTSSILALQRGSIR